MFKFFLAAVAILLLVYSSGYAQWQFVKNFPNDDFKGGQGCHGLAVDPDGKIWIQLFAETDSVVITKVKRPTRVIYVFNADGTPAPFSPIKTITVAGILDSMTTPPGYANRGLRADHQGNILVCNFDRLFRLNYKTGAGMDKVIPRPNSSLTAPGVDAQGNIFTAQVIAETYPIQIFDKSFYLIGTAIDTPKGFSRSFEVSKDSNTIYWTGFTNHAVYRYTRPDEFSPFAKPDTILKGFDAESVAWNPKTGYLWLSAGSYNDLPNRYPGAITSWSPNTWYAYNTETNQIVDSLKWVFNSPNNAFERPRAIAFSVGGDTAYVGCFGGSNYPPVQMFVRQGNRNKVSLSIADTLKGSPGDIIDVPVTLALDGNSIAALGANIKATNKILSFTGFTRGPIIPGERFNVNAPTPDGVILAFTDFGGGPIQQDGVLVTLQFQISSQAEAGAIAKIDFSEIFASDPQFMSLPIRTGAGQVTVVLQPVTVSIADTLAGSPGDTISVPVMLAGAEHPIAALGAAIKATNGLLSFAGFAQGPIIPGATLNVNAPAPDSVRLAYINFGGGPIVNDGVFVALKFRIKPGAPAGAISALVFSDLSASDSNLRALPVRSLPGKVTVVIQPAAIHGIKWHDLNGDGKKDPAEPGLKGWQIGLTGDATLSTTTDSLGNYRFMQLTPGNYVVAEVLQTGWQQSFPPEPGTHNIILAPGQSAGNVDFGNWKTGEIRGMIWRDLNVNESKEANEPVIKGWRVNLAGAANLSTTTDTLGNYAFTSLTPGTYNITVESRDKWRVTFPRDSVHTVELTSAQVAGNINFALEPPVAVEERNGLRLPATFELLQNYPNPFNPSTTIKYGVPRQSRIKIEVFNALGISVAVLVDEFHQPGYYAVKLERTGLPSGMYFYKLTAPGWVETKKMLLMK